MGFRDEFLWSQKTYAEWSLENTARDGFQRNQERLTALQKQVKSTFEQGIDRLAQSQAASSAALQGELAYQADRIREQIADSSRDIVWAVEQGSADIVDSIQKMSDYLGSELCEVRWAIERHSKVSEKILRVMLESLSNESRQYFEQGVKCYETTEFNFARERFNKALEANRTNYFAYQYLGFVAVAEDNSDEALRNFDLARKFAETDYYKALALSHLARSKHALGDDATAVDFAKSATSSYSEAAKFWYELAAYNALLERKIEAVSALREAIERDWTYWAVVSSDADFDSIRFDVNRLLDELRERERQKARQAVDNLKRAIDTAKKANAESETLNFSQKISEFENDYKKNNVYLYREIIPKAIELNEQAFVISEKSLDEQIKNNQQLIREHEQNKNKQIGELTSPITKLESEKNSIEYKKWNAGCWTYGIIGFISLIIFNGYRMEFVVSFILSVIVALAIPNVDNAITYWFGVVRPKQQIEEKISDLRYKVDQQKRYVEDNHRNTVESINSKISELISAKEQCKARQYL